MQKRSLGARLLAVAGALSIGLSLAIPASAKEPDPPKPSVTTEVSPTKINVMGLWAHPDDDASFITPCGVWHDKYGVQCGIIMLTRGEGGSNSVGSEAGPALGLRRENEDRASHFRSGTLDIYNIDAVDFFYNTSAPLTEEVWGSERIQRQVVRVIRQTQPDILMGFSPSLAVGHGNHQYAGRVVWEAAAMAADPTKFPDQFVGPDAVATWQVKTITSGGTTTGTGGSTTTADCNTGYTPAADNPFTVVGTWSGYDSPYKWLDGNVQGQPAGTNMTWAQTGREGFMVHATQARSKLTTVYAPQCLRYGISQSNVPFQPNGSAGNGKDDALLYGAFLPDPGGMPLGSTYAVRTGYFQAPGVPFEVTVSAKSGAGTLAGGTVSLGLPAGWTVSGDATLGPITTGATASVTLKVTPPADATLGRYKIPASFSNGSITAYSDTRIELVAGVEGRFQRWGNYSEYDEWASQFTYVGGRSNAERQIGAGESITVPVIVTNRTTAAQSGDVTLDLPAGITADSASKSYPSLAPGAQTTVNFVLTHTDPASPAGTTANVTITTTAAPAGSTSAETLKLYVVPTTVIPKAATAPTVDGVADDQYGPALDIGRKWEGSDCAPNGIDCGAGSTMRLTWHGDDLYVVATVVDDKVSAAAPPDRCFGHWLVDSVEVLLDPMGGSRDTSTTFKSGILPYTDDPSNSAGNGVDGACWSRDADNHQGFSSGPLAATVKDAPNSPGQEVGVKVTRNNDGTYAGGSYTVETKIPLKNLPAAVITGKAPTGSQATNDVDPKYLGLNVTPYDSDVTTYIGKTRTAWSPFGSQQSEPYRWGHAYLDGYQAPAGRSTTPSTPIIPDTALMGVESPQTIYQSAMRGVTISGLNPTHALTVNSVTVLGNKATFEVTSSEPGTLRAFAWNGDYAMVPVWITSCAGDELGFSTCSPTDITTAPWGSDMGGRVLGTLSEKVTSGKSTFVMTLPDGAKDEMKETGSFLISFQSSKDEVQAWNYPVVEGTVTPTPTPTPTPTVKPTPTPTAKPTVKPWTFEPKAPYTKPGFHNVNGRRWFTDCQPYSQTQRCRTDIWATTVVRTGNTFSMKQAWVFNNLTYLPYMKREQWANNPLGHTGAWTASDGRKWRTECDTPATGRDGCRSYAMTTVYSATPKQGGGYTFSQKDQWVFNNIVLFPPKS